MARRVVTLKRPSEAAALIGRQVRVTQKGWGRSVRVWPGTHESQETPFFSVCQGECTGYSFTSSYAVYLQIAGLGQIDVSEPGTTIERVTPWWGHRLIIYLGLAEAPYCF